MQDERTAEIRWPRWIPFFALWTVVAAFTASQRVLYFAATGRPARLIEEPLSHFGAWYLWALLSLVIVRLGRRFPLERHCWRRSLLVHLPASVALGFVHIVVDFPIDRALAVPAAAAFKTYVLAYYQFNILTYWAILGVGSAFDYNRKFREREIRASQLEARLAQAQLQVLRTQLQPHFLFNTLHAISTLMRRDVESADRMLARLGDLLRLAIDGDGEQVVPLRREIEFLDRYVEIMRMRFEDQLRVRIDVAPEVLDALVPSLVLQPIVENAIRHGTSSRPGGGTVEVRVRADGPRLEMRVADDGPGLGVDLDEASRRGLGLANTRARLDHLYGVDFAMSAGRSHLGGAEVSLSFPLRMAAPAARERARADAGAAGAP